MDNRTKGGWEHFKLMMSGEGRGKVDSNLSKKIKKVQVGLFKSSQLLYRLTDLKTQKGLNRLISCYWTHCH